MNASDDKIWNFIRKHHVLTLCVCSEGKPWCANIFYAHIPDRNIFIYTSEPRTRHGAGAVENPNISGSIVLETRMVGRVQGLQIEGTTRRVREEDGGSPRKAYLKRFPYAVVADLDLWILEPSLMKLTDNTLGFGKKLIWRKDEQ